MSQVAIVTRLAVRELWISYRLLAVLVSFVGAATSVALLPAPLPVLMPRLAAGLGAATVIVAAVTAWSIAEERRSGRAGWLVARSVGRGTVLGGWFAATAGATVVGLLCAGAIGWLVVSGASQRLGLLAYAAPMAAVVAAGIAAVAMGLLAGILLRPLTAAVAAASAGLGLGLAAWTMPEAVAMVPGGAFVVLGALTDGAQGSSGAWRATGIGLVTAGVLLGIARLTVDRVEL